MRCANNPIERAPNPVHAKVDVVGSIVSPDFMSIGLSVCVPDKPRGQRRAGQGIDEGRYPYRQDLPSDEASKALSIQSGLSHDHGACLLKKWFAGQAGGYLARSGRLRAIQLSILTGLPSERRVW